ncbi:substrate-binding domain-containing protein [Vibrio wakamikoensis]|uniref:substrate-binding domain-containing protein n=1 Tax=Vibrio wakamikoensis TaxID=2910251 RepID=UPI003D1DE539
MPSSKPTLNDIALAASVSISTLNRYIHQRGFVSRDKQLRIQKAMVTLGYQPKPTKNKVTDKLNYLVGVLSPYALCPHSNAILSGLEGELGKYQLSPVVMIGNWNNTQEQTRTRQLIHQGVDALVVIGSSLTAPQLIEIALQLPIITIGGHDIKHPNIHCISNSGLVGGDMATNHLLRLGHTDIVYLSGLVFHPDSQQRLLGYKQALDKAGIDYCPERVVNGKFDVASGRDAVRKLLCQGVQFTAIFAANDQMAFGAISTLKEAGIQVPHQVSVVGFDDHEVSAVFTPALTTLRQPSLQFGRLAATRVASALGLFVEEEYQTSEDDFVHLIIRDSCGENNKIKDEKKG